MAENYTVYPDDIDSASQLPVAVDNVTPVKAEVVNRLRSAILAVESELGIQPSSTYTTVRARLDALEAVLDSLGGSITSLGLSAVLTIGNETDGHDIIISNGNSLVNEAGTVSISGHVYSNAISFPELAANPLPVVSGKGTLWLKNTNVLVYTDDSGTDHDLLTGAETLAATLALGNSTGGNNIEITNGDEIVGEPGVGAGSGGVISVTGGTGGSTGVGGSLLFSGGSGGSSSGNGGSITFQGGQTNDGNGGSISIIGNNGVGSNKSGGNVTITAGNSTGTVDGANITLTPGISGGSGSDGIIYLDGYVDVLGNKITNVAIPTNNLDAANKEYVDNVASVSGEICFRLSGEYSAISIPAYVDSTYVTTTERTLSSVTLSRRTAGTSGTTKIDVYKNGVSIFAADIDKPQVTAAGGDLAYDQSVTFSTNSFIVGDFIDIVIDSVETYLAGPPEGPEGITVILKFV